MADAPTSKRPSVSTVHSFAQSMLVQPCRAPLPQSRPQTTPRSIEHQVVRQWSFLARLTVLPPGWAPKGEGSSSGGSGADGLASGSPAARAAAAAGANAVFSAWSPAGAAEGGAIANICPLP